MKLALACALLCLLAPIPHAALADDGAIPRAGGGSVSLSEARAAGPVAIIFYRGHW